MHQIRDAFGVYHVLEILLKATDKPLTCVELYDDPDVKKFAPNVNKVSDYLGHMWRRGLLGRMPAAKQVGSQARWSYFWKNDTAVPNALLGPKAERPAPAPVQVPELPEDTTEQTTTSTEILSKPSIAISESGGVVVIDLPSLVITIKTK